MTTIQQYGYQVCRVVFQETVLNINKPFTSRFSGNIRYDVFSVDFVISFQYITCLYDFYTDESFVNLQRKNKIIVARQVNKHKKEQRK